MASIHSSKGPSRQWYGWLRKLRNIIITTLIKNTKENNVKILQCEIWIFSKDSFL